MSANRPRRSGRMERPAKSDEPYRLWFEFLKLAITDPEIKVDSAFYEPWGDVQAVDFKSWWDDNWMDLFAVDIGVYKIKDFHKLLLPRRYEIIVRLPLYRDPIETLKRVKQLLIDHRASDRLMDMPSGQFYLDVGKDSNGEPINPATRFLRNLVNVGVLLNFYRFWIKNINFDDRLRYEQTSWDYYNWYREGRNLVNRNDRGPDPRHLPPGLEDYIAYLDHRDGRKTGQPTLDIGKGDIMQRRQIVRYITKARKIAANVGRGQFPGNY